MTRISYSWDEWWLSEQKCSLKFPAIPSWTRVKKEPILYPELDIDTHMGKKKAVKERKREKKNIEKSFHYQISLKKEKEKYGC